MVHAVQGSFLRETIIATVVLAAFYGLTYGIQFQPLQIPGYLLLMGFGTFGGAFGLRPLFPVIFSIYLISLGLVGATTIHVVRRRILEVHLANWRLGVASAFGVMGLLAVLFTVAILIGTSQMDAVLTTGISGIVLLGLAGWFAGLLTFSTGWN